MSAYKQGEIVVVPFPFADRPASNKRRPAVARPSKLATLDEPRLLHRLGQLPSAQWAELIAYLRGHLADR